MSNPADRPTNSLTYTYHCLMHLRNLTLEKQHRISHQTLFLIRFVRFWLKFEGNRPFLRPRPKLDDNIKINLKEIER
jgi:hypothetical protein